MSNLIRREDALDAIQKRADEVDSVYSAFWEGLIIAQDIVEKVPSAELEDFEWCHDCKEYDQEKHCCHRWTKVIRKTVEEMKTNWRWIPVTEALPNNAEYDWVLGQIRETNSGYLWIPRQVEYRESKDDWYEESIGWLKENPDHAFKVIAWMPLPKAYRGE